MKRKIFTSWWKSGVKALLTAMVVSSAMAIGDLPINMHVYDGSGVAVQESGVDMIRSFGISSQSDALAPPPSPGPPSTSLWFKKVLGGGEQNLSGDYRGSATTVTWKLSASLLPEGGYQLGGFNTSAYSAFGKLTIEGPGIVSAKDITGDFTDPSNYIAIEDGDYTITYLELASKGVTVNLQQSDGSAVEGATWRLSTEPESTKHPSGYTLAGVSQGNHTVVFSDVPNYITPVDQDFSVSGVAKVAIAATYMREKNTVTVNYNFDDPGIPTVDSLSQTTWKLKDSSGNYLTFNSKEDFTQDTVLTGVATGSYTIEFSDVFGASNAWTKPADLPVTVNTLEGLVVDGDYQLIPGEITTNFSEVTIKEGEPVDLTYTMTVAPVGTVTITVGLTGDVSLSAENVVFSDQDPANYPMTKSVTITGTAVGGADSNPTPKRTDANEPRFTDSIPISVTVISNDAPAPGNLSLVNVTALDFGDVMSGETYTRYIQVKNTGADIPPTFTATVLGANDFECDSTAVAIGAGKSIFIPVAFSSTTEGTQTATVQLAENGTPRFDIQVKANVITDAPVAGAMFYFDPEVIIANPDEATGNSFEATYDLMVAHTASVTGSLTFTVPTTCTNVTGTGVRFDATTGVVTVDATKTGTSDEEVLAEITMTVDTSNELTENISFNLTGITDPAATAATKSQLIISNQVQLTSVNVDGDDFVTFNDTLFILRYVSVYLKLPESVRSPEIVVESPAELPTDGTLSAQDVVDNIAKNLDGFDVDHDGFVTFNDTLFILRYVSVYLKLPESVRSPEIVVESSAELPSGSTLTAQDVVDNISKIYQ